VSGDLETKSKLKLVVGIVADGVGSADFGANAAQIAIETVIKSFKESDDTSIPQIIDMAMKQANMDVFEENNRSKGED